jgi:taurine---2-oxoglutarate transaminase
MIKNIRTLIPWVKQNSVSQIQILKADNCYIYSNKDRYIDFTSGAMAVNLGHNNKYILNGIKEHMNSGISYVPSYFSNYQRDKLSARLTNILPAFNKVLFTNAGADANEAAIFMSKEYFRLKTGVIKNRTLSFERSFHGGSTVGSSLISGDSRRYNKTKYYKMPLDPILENPKMDDNGNSSLIQIENIFKNNHYNVSSILVEGSSGTAGCVLYPENYLKRLHDICKFYNIIMICDEVMSGWGRTGSLFAYQKQNVQPDIITTAKAITSGYSPLGAVFCSDKISNMFNDNSLEYGLTYSGHNLSCTIANKCLDLYEENDFEIVKDVNRKSRILSEKCIDLKNRYSFIKDFRLNGLLGCFEFNLSNEEIINISNILLSNNIFCLRMRENIFVSPPLTINDNLLVYALNKIDQSFYEYEKINKQP